MKIFTVALLALTLMVSACASSKTINGVEYQPYGLANMDKHKNPDIEYEISFGSVLVAIFFSETIIMPVYVVGWDLYQPVRKKSDFVH